MRTPDFVIGQGDLLEPLVVVIRDSQRTPVNLTGRQVVFQMRRLNGTTLVIAEAAMPDPDQTAHPGLVRYYWQDGDTDVAGDYYADFLVTVGGESPATYPNDDSRKLYIRVSQKLA